VPFHPDPVSRVKHLLERLVHPLAVRPINRHESKPLFKPMRMLFVFTLIAALQGLKAWALTPDDLAIVRAEVFSSTVNEEDDRGHQRAGGGTVFMKIKLRVVEVLRTSAVPAPEEVVTIATDSAPPSVGRTYVLSPVPKQGEQCVMAIFQEKTGTWFDAGVAGLPVGILGNRLPLFSGRDARYDDVLKWLRDRRDHPERKTQAGKPSLNAENSQAPSSPDVPVIHVSAVKSVPVALPTINVDSKATLQGGSAWWWIGGAVVVLGTLVLVWLRRHTVKGGGT